MLDLAGDGTPASTGWLSPAVTFLVLDRNGDQQITSLWPTDTTTEASCDNGNLIGETSSFSTALLGNVEFATTTTPTTSTTTTSSSDPLDPYQALVL